MLLALTHLCFPRARPHTRKFVELAYRDPATGRYAKGWDDGALVLCGVVVLTGLRGAAMEYVLAPLAQLGGIARRKERVRFAEQAWIFLCHSAWWALDLVRFLPSSRRAQAKRNEGVGWGLM